MIRIRTVWSEESMIRIRTVWSEESMIRIRTLWSEESMIRIRTLWSEESVIRIWGIVFRGEYDEDLGPREYDKDLRQCGLRRV